MLLQFPAPKSWEEFEALCHQLWRDIWVDSNAQRHGRNGQPQAGVDIYGEPRYSKGFSGVQCKLKDIATLSALTPDEVDEEGLKAGAFRPRLQHFTIATTGPRDEEVQRAARDFRKRCKMGFGLSVWSWHDISQELSYRSDVAAKIYGPQLPQTPTPAEEETTITRGDPADKLFAILSRPTIRSQLPSRLLQDLGTLLFELVDNAFRHGGASRISLSINGGSVLLRDDGLPFNSLSNAKFEVTSLRDSVGLWAVGRFIRKFNRTAKMTWREGAGGRASRPDQSGNELLLEFSSQALQIAQRESPDLRVSFLLDPREVDLMASEARARKGSHEFHVHFKDPAALSPATKLVRALRETLPADVTLVVSATETDDILDYVREIRDPGVIVGSTLKA